MAGVTLGFLEVHVYRNLDSHMTIDDFSRDRQPRSSSIFDTL